MYPRGEYVGMGTPPSEPIFTQSTQHILDATRRYTSIYRNDRTKCRYAYDQKVKNKVRYGMDETKLSDLDCQQTS
jgi:hypothetical protein